MSYQLNLGECGYYMIRSKQEHYSMATSKTFTTSSHNHGPALTPREGILNEKE